MYTLRSVGVLSVGKTFAVIQGALGLILLPIFVIAGLASAMLGKGEDAFAGGVMIVFAVMIPVLYAAIGFVMGVVMAAIYNAVASRIGGIKLELAPPAPADAMMPSTQMPR